MELAGYFTILVILMVLSLLVFTRIPADVVLMFALSLLIISNVLEPSAALLGFSNPGVMTIAVLYVVASGLKETGAVQWIATSLLGFPQTTRLALFRVLMPGSVLSAFMNNTAVVAMFIPAIQNWAQRLNVPASKLLLPLSYAAILGGTCTVIGTSTNLIISGMLQSELDVTINMFEPALVGIPILLCGSIVILLLADRLLPFRHGFNEQIDSAREYSVELVVDKAGPIPGKTVAEAGLRHLAHGYLVDIQRGEQLLTAVPPETKLEGGDMLIFVGSPDCAHELRSVHGLRPVNGDVEELDVAMQNRCLVEALVGPEFVGLNQTIKESRFRSRFQAAILSVSREGGRLEGKIGDIKLQVGDTLLLESSKEFVDQYRSRRDFLLVSTVNESSPPDFKKAPVAIAILLMMVLASAFSLVSILEAALVAAGGMLLSGCVSASKARRSIDLTVLVVIAASFSLGVAMEQTGAASYLAGMLVVDNSMSPLLALALVYLITVMFTEAITNNAAAVLMFPIAVAVSDHLGVSFMPFVIAVMFAASASFLTPLGYQTNLMVLSPGGYRVSDYLKLGFPVSLSVSLLSIFLIPQIWPFY